MKEYTLSINNKFIPKVYENEDALVLLIHKLLIMQKGESLEFPDMGVGLLGYRYDNTDSNVVENLSSEISDQIFTYIGGLSSVDVEYVPNNDQTLQFNIKLDGRAVLPVLVDKINNNLVNLRIGG